MLILLCICPSFLWSQTNFNISFGDILPLNHGELNYSFRFKENGNNVQLKGDQIRSYVFQYPGRYRIEVEKLKHSHAKETDECLELHIPAQVFVWVDSVRMIFNPSSLVLSSPIRKNSASDGIVASIGVEIQNYYSNPVQMNEDIVPTAGIGTKIVAKLNPNQKSLPPGVHTLNYTLHGICSESSFIQFDFISHNGTISPVGLKSQILE